MSRDHCLSDYKLPTINFLRLQLFFLSEFVERGGLDKNLDQLSVQQRWSVLVDMAEAMAYVPICVN